MTSITPQFRRTLLAMALMAECIAKCARLLAASEEDEAGDELISTARGLFDDEGGA